jgi:hypothetical protein
MRIGGRPRQLYAQPQLGVMGAPAGPKEGWMNAVRRWRQFAMSGSCLALALGALALLPGAASASTHACANHTFVLEIETELGKPKTKYNLPVKQITTEGVSCASALKFLSGYLKTGKASEGYKCGIAKFKAPGLVPERCTKPGKKIQFAHQGG